MKKFNKTLRISGSTVIVAGHGLILLLERICFHLISIILQAKRTKLKRTFLQCLLATTIASSLSSCATVFGGKVTQAQRTPPKAGEPKRAVRAIPLIADVILFWPGVAVDFITGAIYKPEGNSTNTVEPKRDTVATSTTPDSK
jgi:hypothetical protein